MVNGQKGSLKKIDEKAAAAAGVFWLNGMIYEICS